MLSESQIEEFFERGYLRLPAFFGPAAVAEMRQAFVRLEHRAGKLERTGELDGALFVIERQGGQPLKIERVVWCGAAEPSLAALGRSPELLQAMAQLLGVPVLDQLINQAHIKKPGDGVAFFYHQDSYHRRYGTPLFQDLNGRGSFVQSLTAVDPMGPENGGLWLIPKSHELGHIPTENGRLPDGSVDPTRALPVALESGDTLLLNPFTVHGSAPNSGNTKRRLFINGFCCAGANRRRYPGAGTGLRLRVFDSASVEAYDNAG